MRYSTISKNFFSAVNNSLSSVIYKLEAEEIEEEANKLANIKSRILLLAKALKINDIINNRALKNNEEYVRCATKQLKSDSTIIIK